MGRKNRLVTNCYYHVYNRGVDKRKIFIDNRDYFRFIHCLYEFNDVNAVLNVGWRFSKYVDPSSIVKQREKLTEILCFCLMPNHFHLILKQIKEDGISKFMQKLGTSHAMYFNKKNQRSGALFEGRFKYILIEKDEYFVSLSRYIHLNPLELIAPEWKQKVIKHWEKANKFLEQYRWSSYLDYVGKKNFPSVTDRKFLLDYFKGKDDYKKFVNSWIKKDIAEIESLVIE